MTSQEESTSLGDGKMANSDGCNCLDMKSGQRDAGKFIGFEPYDCINRTQPGWRLKMLYCCTIFREDVCCNLRNVSFS